MNKQSGARDERARLSNGDDIDAHLVVVYSVTHDSSDEVSTTTLCGAHFAEAYNARAFASASRQRNAYDGERCVECMLATKQAFDDLLSRAGAALEGARALMIPFATSEGDGRTVDGALAQASNIVERIGAFASAYVFEATIDDGRAGDLPSFVEQVGELAGARVVAVAAERPLSFALVEE